MVTYLFVVCGPASWVSLECCWLEREHSKACVDVFLEKVRNLAQIPRLNRHVVRYVEIDVVLTLEPLEHSDKPSSEGVELLL